MPRPSEFEVWSDSNEILLTRCHTCVLKVAPDTYQATLRDRFDHILDIHNSLRHILVWSRDRTGTPCRVPAPISYMTWYPVNRGGPKEPYIEEFMVMGRVADTFTREAARRELAWSPTYRLGGEGMGSGFPLVGVHLVTHARLPVVPDAFLEWRWDPNIPTWSWEPMIRGFRHASAKDLADLTERGRRLFAIHRASRGPQIGKHKRYPDGEDDAFLKDVKAVLATHEADGLRFTSVQLFADYMEMGKTALYKMFERVPEAHELVRRHMQRPPRR